MMGSTLDAERGQALAPKHKLQVQLAAQQELIDASEAIRQAEAERRARSFLARLSAALWGE